MYNRQQQLFGLSMLANLSTGLTGSPAELKSTLNARIQDNLYKFKDQFGPWKLIDSAVYQAPDSIVADNAIYLAQNQASSDDLVLAVAATNATSIWDWIVEDTMVLKQVPWDMVSEKYTIQKTISPQIAYGTYVGLRILQKLYSSMKSRLPSDLFTFGHELTVVGHSLGGALAPALALWIEENDNNGGIINCFTTAGPTPGNRDFADHFHRVIRDENYDAVNNLLDVVPRSWCSCSGCMGGLNTLYEPAISATWGMTAMLTVLYSLSQGQRYARLDNQNKYQFEGKINTDIIDKNKSPFVNYLNQMAYQHVDAYFDHFGMQELKPILQGVRDRSASSSQIALEWFQKIMHGDMNKAG